MVKAYRDTWELGRPFVLGYFRERAHSGERALARLAAASSFRLGTRTSIVSGAPLMRSLAPLTLLRILRFEPHRTNPVEGWCQHVDYLLWYARDPRDVKYRQLYVPKGLEDEVGDRLYPRESGSLGLVGVMTDAERTDPSTIARWCARISPLDSPASAGATATTTVPSLISRSAGSTRPNAALEDHA